MIECFLPSSDDQKKTYFSVDNYPFILETLSLVESLLPQREEESSGEEADKNLAGETP
jgi:hypothetical protein